jgi:hypothetical protein
VIGADPRFLPRTALTGLASYTSAGTARTGCRRHLTLRAGPSHLPAGIRPHRAVRSWPPESGLGPGPTPRPDRRGTQGMSRLRRAAHAPRLPAPKTPDPDDLVADAQVQPRPGRTPLTAAAEGTPCSSSGPRRLRPVPSLRAGSGPEPPQPCLRATQPEGRRSWARRPPRSLKSTRPARGDSPGSGWSISAGRQTKRRGTPQEHGRTGVQT